MSRIGSASARSLGSRFEYQDLSGAVVFVAREDDSCTHVNNPRRRQSFDQTILDELRISPKLMSWSTKLDDQTVSSGLPPVHTNLVLFLQASSGHSCLGVAL